MLSRFESGDANPKDVVIALAQRGEEERHHRIESQVEKFSFYLLQLTAAK